MNNFARWTVAKGLINWLKQRYRHINILRVENKTAFSLETLAPTCQTTLCLSAEEHTVNPPQYEKLVLT